MSEAMPKTVESSRAEKVPSGDVLLGEMLTENASLRELRNGLVCALNDCMGGAHPPERTRELEARVEEITEQINRLSADIVKRHTELIRASAHGTSGRAGILNVDILLDPNYTEGVDILLELDSSPQKVESVESMEVLIERIQNAQTLDEVMNTLTQYGRPIVDEDDRVYPIQKIIERIQKAGDGYDEHTLEIPRRYGLQKKVREIIEGAYRRT